jgi:hypothetical protein
MTHMAAHVRASSDESLGAFIVSRRALRYRAGPCERDDRPAHVRAGSGLVRFENGLAVIQDDADFVALIDGGTGSVEAVPLPRRGSGARVFDDARGNKADKRDFEACFVAEVAGVETLVAFGSGSTGARESILVLSRLDGAPVPRVIEAPRFYATLREATEFSGSELNIEGAVLVGATVKLFQRGNGAPRDGRRPVNATCDIEWSALAEVLEGRVPEQLMLDRIVEFDLGSVSGCRLTFTDATPIDADRILYLAAAESSPDAVRDGPVVGAAVGVIRWDAERVDARYALLRDERGAPSFDKAEGIALADSKTRVHIVLDADDPTRPAELCSVELQGDWF